MLNLPQITIAGTPNAMGKAYGEVLAPLIRAFVEQRLRAARAYLWERGHRGLDPLLKVARDSLDLVEDWDPDGWIEHRAIAVAAGVDPVQLFCAANMTDLRDVIAAPRVGDAAAEAEGCTTALLGPAFARDHVVVAGQTWDLNPPDVEFVVAVRREPLAGPVSWTVTCAGCQTLVGMNEAGVAVGTTNIKVRGAQAGIPYLSLLHRALRADDRHDALTCIAMAPRAAAHTYWAADVDGVGDLECSAYMAIKRDGAQGPLFRTNHCLDDGHQRNEAEAATASSQARLAKVASWLAKPQDAPGLKALFADRSDGVNSVNRYAEDNQGTATNACVVAVPARRELHACRGPADRGEWVILRPDPN